MRYLRRLNNLCQRESFHHVVVLLRLGACWWNAWMCLTKLQIRPPRARDLNNVPQERLLKMLSQKINCFMVEDALEMLSLVTDISY